MFTEKIRTYINNGNIWLTILLGVVLLNGCLWAWIIPFDGAPDEVHKYEITYFIWHNHHLPVFGPDADLYIREAPGTRDGYVYGVSATYPFGAYLLAAILMVIVPVSKPLMLLHVARLASVIFNLVTVYFAYRIVSTLFGHRRYAIWIAGLIALIPQFTYTGAYVGDDAYLIAAMTWILWAVISGLEQGWTRKNQVQLASALVMATLGKFNVWVVVLPFVVLAFFSTWDIDWPERLRAWAVMFLPPTLSLGGWLLRNIYLYHDLFALDVGRVAWADYTERIGFNWITLAEQGYKFTDLFTQTDWLRTVFESFWGRFFYMDVVMDARIYNVLLAGCSAGLILTLVAFWRLRDTVLPSATVKKFFICSLISLAILFAFSAATSFYNDYQPQGRYFFPLIVPIMVLLTLGGYVLSQTYLPRYRGWMGALIILGLFALNAYALIHYIHCHPYPDIPLPITSHASRLTFYIIGG